MKNQLISLAMLGIAGSAAAAPEAPRAIERRMYSDSIESSSFLWNDWNKFVENYHPNYVADDDPATAWVEGATTSGAGEWVRIELTPLEHTTRVRLKIRNGYQKSAPLFQANARAKAMTIKLLPGTAAKQVTLTDTEGWQEVVIDQASGPVRAVELKVDSVYEGGRYPDLCISDVQVFATSTTKDNPAFEKSKRDDLRAWRASRIAAAKALTGRVVMLPIYSAYAITSRDHQGDHRGDLKGMLERAKADAAFHKEFQSLLATAWSVVGAPDALQRVQLAPTTKQKLVEVDGIQIPGLDSVDGAYFDEASLRLPMMGTVAAMFADQLRVLDVKTKQTPTQFEESTNKKCKTDAVWALRGPAKEGTGPQLLRALLVGRCGMVDGREGSYLTHTTELLVYDASGRLGLVVGAGHIEGYRWAIDAGKPMLTGGRSILAQGTAIEAKQRGVVAQQ